MLYREIFRILGVFFLYFALVFIVPLTFSLYEADYTAKDFMFAALVSFLLGLGLLYLGGKSTGTFYRREGIVSVVLIWFIVPLISALPFLTSGTIQDPFQAYFEMVSGFTTTGSSSFQAKAYNEKGQEVPIVHTVQSVRPITYTFYGNVTPIRDADTGKIVKEGVEAVAHPLLFWRSFTQWLGGGGIVVLFVAVLPALGMGRKVLYQSEVTNQTQEGMIPTIKETAINLWKIYLFLTIGQIIILMGTNPDLPFFEAISITFSTISTGGFSTKNQSIAGYHDVATEWIVIIFMILGSVSFSLYYFLFKGKFYKLFQPEFLVFMASLVVFSGLCYASLGHHGNLREAIFQMVSAQSSTGFFTSNYNVWPYSIQILIIIAMFIGGMAGSTAGGIKIIRHIILFKSAQYRAESIFLPERVRIFKLGGREIEAGVVLTVLCFFFLAMAMSTLGTLVYVYDGIDPETAFSVTSCMLNNTGMGFRMAGPEFSCAFLSDFSLLFSSFLMIFGRLEYYAVLALLIPAFWRQES